MSTETIVVQVSPEMAVAYRAASKEERQKLDLLVNLRFRVCLESGGLSETVIEKISQEAITETIVVHVSSDMATAYRATSGWNRRRLDMSATLQLAEYFESRGSLKSVIDAMSREAAVTGLTLDVIGVAAITLASRLPDVVVFGQKTGTVPKELALAFAAVAYALVLWQYYVLTRPDIRKLFGMCDSCSSRDYKWITQ